MHPNVKDITGQVFGKLTVLKFSEMRNSHAFWECICECGNIKIIEGSLLRRGNCKSCGCLREVNGLEGKKFGRLLVMEKTKQKVKNGGYLWNCLCDCGNEILVSCHSLKTGNTQSCGCLQKDATSKPLGESAFNSLFSQYKLSALARNLKFELCEDEFKKLTSSNCFYCGCEPNQSASKKSNGKYFYNGIDRIDSNYGYIKNNVVSCCGNCNRGKYTQTQEEFYNWINRTYNYMKKNGLINFD